MKKARYGSGEYDTASIAAGRSCHVPVDAIPDTPEGLIGINPSTAELSPNAAGQSRERT